MQFHDAWQFGLTCFLACRRVSNVWLVSCQGQQIGTREYETPYLFSQRLFENQIIPLALSFYGVLNVSVYQSLPSSLCLVGVSKGFHPGAGANFFEAFSVAFFSTVCFKPSCFRSSLWDLLVRLLMALRLSLANSLGVFQGDSHNWSEKGNSVANSSKDVSGVLKVDEADFSF